jgi:exopolyphosphatase/guanosine-5'-triphosphate,3'-diphosphate pyrophosphatase
VTSLGKGLIKTGILNRDNTYLSIISIVEFKAICDIYNVQKIRIVGTSALREALDSASFVNKVHQFTGLNLEIISGEREAELTLAGMINLDGPDSRNGSVIALDIGGGSTELIVAGDADLKFSIPVGVLKLYEQFAFGDPPSLSVLQSLRAFILARADQSISHIRNALLMNGENKLIATGGTVTNLAAIDLGLSAYDGDKVHGCVLDYSMIKSIFDKLVSIPLNDRFKVAGLEKERADLILPGAVMVMTIMESLDLHQLTVSDYGLMEGIILSDI